MWLWALFASYLFYMGAITLALRKNRPQRQEHRILSTAVAAENGICQRMDDVRSGNLRHGRSPAGAASASAAPNPSVAPSPQDTVGRSASATRPSFRYPATTQHTYFAQPAQ